MIIVSLSLRNEIYSLSRHAQARYFLTVALRTLYSMLRSQLSAEQHYQQSLLSLVCLHHALQSSH